MIHVCNLYTDLDIILDYFYINVGRYFLKKLRIQLLLLLMMIKVYKIIFLACVMWNNKEGRKGVLVGKSKKDDTSKVCYRVNRVLHTVMTNHVDKVKIIIAETESCAIYIRAHLFFVPLQEYDLYHLG